MKRRIDKVIHALVLIRFGQELGTDSQAARAVASAIDFAISAAKNFLG